MRSLPAMLILFCAAGCSQKATEPPQQSPPPAALPVEAAAPSTPPATKTPALPPPAEPPKPRGQESRQASQGPKQTTSKTSEPDVSRMVAEYLDERDRRHNARIETVSGIIQGMRKTHVQAPGYHGPRLLRMPRMTEDPDAAALLEASREEVARLRPSLRESFCNLFMSGAWPIASVFAPAICQVFGDGDAGSTPSEG